MSRHYLTQIDLVARTAICSVCGPTQVHMTRPRTENPPLILCMQRARERRQQIAAYQQKAKPAGRPRHTLSRIDEEKCTALCAICGPTDVYRSNSKGRITFRCATYTREFNRRTWNAHIVNPNASVHILSEVDEEKRTAVCAKCGPVRIVLPSDPSFAAGRQDPDPGIDSPTNKKKRTKENIRLVDEYKRRHVCKRCGSTAILEPRMFAFFEMHLPRRQRIWVLVDTMEEEDLAAELEKRDMYCIKCLGVVSSAFANNTPVPEFRPFQVEFTG